MGKNSEQRRKAKARATAKSEGISYQQARYSQNHTDPDSPPDTGRDASGSRSWGSSGVEEGELLEDLRLRIPEDLPRVAGAYIAKIVADFGSSRDVVRPYDEDRDLTLLDQFEARIVLIGGRMPERRAAAMTRAGAAALAEGEDGKDHGDGVAVVFPVEHTIHSHNMVAVIGMHEEPQGWEHSWEDQESMEDSHPWKERGSR